jgi:hypothetical protein
MRHEFWPLKISLFVASWTSFFQCHFTALAHDRERVEEKGEKFYVFDHGITSAKKAIVETGEKPAQNFGRCFSQ